MRRSRSIVLLVAAAAAILSSSGCRSDSEIADGASGPVLEVRAGSIGETAGWDRTDIVVGGGRVWMSPEVAIDASMVRSAARTNDAEGRPAVLVELDEGGAEALERLSTAQLSRPLVILVNGRPTSAPIVMSPLGARFMITADDLTDDTCDDLVRRLSDG